VDERIIWMICSLSCSLHRILNNDIIIQIETQKRKHQDENDDDDDDEFDMRAVV